MSNLNREISIDETVEYIEEMLKEGYYIIDSFDQDYADDISLEKIELFYKYGRLDGCGCYSSLYSNYDTNNLTLLDMILVLTNINISRKWLLDHCANKFGIVKQL